MSTSSLAMEPRSATMRKPSLQQWYLQWKYPQATLIKTADNKLRKVQTRQKRYFHTRRRHRNDKVSPGNSVFTEVTLADQARKVAPIATCTIPVVAVDTPTVTIQRPDNSVEKMSRNRIAKTSPWHSNDNKYFLPHLRENFPILDLPSRRRAHVLASHGSTLKEGGKGSEPVNFDESATSIHDAEYYRATDRAKISKQPMYVVSKGVDGPNQTPIGPEYRVKRYWYDSNIDNWEQVNQIPRSYILAYWKCKKISITDEIDRCI